MRVRWELGSDTEYCVDELTLSYRIALGDPTDLSFADGMRCGVGIVRVETSGADGRSFGLGIMAPAPQKTFTPEAALPGLDGC